MTAQVKRRALLFALATMAAAGVAACGRKGALKPVNSSKKKTAEKPKSE